MPKRRKLTAVFGDASIEDVLHKGRISIAGLAEVMKALGNLEGGQSVRHELMDINRARLLSVKHTFPLTSVDGDPLQWSILDPTKMLRD